METLIEEVIIENKDLKQSLQQEFTGLDLVKYVESKVKKF